MVQEGTQKSGIADLIEAFGKVDPLQMNTKKIKKTYQKKFQMYRSKCRMRMTCKFIEYNNLSEQICSLFYESVKKPTNITNGNLIVLMLILDDHIEFLADAAERFKALQDKIMLEDGHNVIIEKQKELVETLKENLKVPLTLEQIQQQTEIDE